MLCVKFGYHPLALELCGSNMRRYGRTPREQLDKVISDPLNLSKPGHVGLEALLKESVFDLNQQSHGVFVAFGAFFENGMSSALLGVYLNQSIKELDRNLDNLTDFNLIKRRPGTEFYYMHDLIFTYAQSLAKGIDDGFIKIINAVVEYLSKNANKTEFVALDLPNLLSIANVSDKLDLIKIISYLTIGKYPFLEGKGRSYLDQRGYDVRWKSISLIEQLDRAIEAGRAIGYELKPTTHYLLGKRGAAAFWHGEYEQAVEKYKEELLLSPNDERRAFVASNLANTLAFCEGEKYKDESREYFDMARELAEELHNDELHVFVLEQEIWAAGYLKDYERAFELAEKQLPLAEAL